jgi:hypothetical protein
VQKDRREFIDRAYLIFLLWKCEAMMVSLDRAYSSHLEARRAADLSNAPVFSATQRAFTDFESALTFAADVAKMLAPRFLRPNERVAATTRARRIRKLLGLRKRHPSLRLLHKALVMRNHFEHLDTRLDTWASQTKGTALLMHALSKDLSFVEQPDRFNRFDPNTGQLKMLGDSIEVNKLLRVIVDIWNLALRANRGIERRLGLPGLH